MSKRRAGREFGVARVVFYPILIKTILSDSVL